MTCAGVICSAYRKLGNVFDKMIHARMDDLNELVDALVLNWLRASYVDEWTDDED